MRRYLIKVKYSEAAPLLVSLACLFVLVPTLSTCMYPRRRVLKPTALLAGHLPRGIKIGIQSSTLIAGTSLMRLHSFESALAV